MSIGLLGCLVDPPLPPQWAPGAAHVHSQCLSWSPGRSIFRSFFRFDFGLDFGLILGTFLARLGRLLGPFWEAKSGQVGSKMRLEPSFYRKRRFSRQICKINAKWPTMPPRCAQDRLNIGPRRGHLYDFQRISFVQCLTLIYFWNTAKVNLDQH